MYGVDGMIEFYTHRLDFHDMPSVENMEAAARYTAERHLMTKIDAKGLHPIAEPYVHEIRTESAYGAGFCEITVAAEVEKDV